MNNNYKKKLLFLVCFLPFALSYSQPLRNTSNSSFKSVKKKKNHKYDLIYSFQRKDSNSLLITLSFQGNAGGSSLIYLPNEWAGQQKLYNAVSSLTSEHSDIIVEPTDTPFVYKLKYPPQSSVTINYILSKDWQGPIDYPLYFRPVIQKDFFYFEGYSGLVYPAEKFSEAIKCRVIYRGFGANTICANSFFTNDTSRQFTTTMENLLNGIYCAGDFRLRITNERHRKIVMAVNGSFDFPDTTFFNSISSIINGERKFWNDIGSPYYFVFLQSAGRPGNYGGTAHFNSFCLFVNQSQKLNDGPLDLIAHEYFHNWIGQSLKTPQPHDEYRWFQEGFTDYYSFKLLHSFGILSNDEFINRLNKNFKQYYLSQYFDTSNEALIGRFWQNNELKILPYRRGLTIAFALDEKIQSLHPQKSLDNLMKDFYNRSKPEMVFSSALFNEMILQYADADMLNAIKEAIKGNNTALTRLILNNDLYKSQVLVVDKRFSLGFNLNESKRLKKIVGLKPNSPAMNAGLKEGMEITGAVSIWDDNIEKPARIQVLINGEKKWVEYLPAEQIHIEMPQIISLNK